MWGAHCGVLWPQPSSPSQGGQAHLRPATRLGHQQAIGLVSGSVE